MIIDISVKNKIATLVDPNIYGVCHNSDYTIHFDFDSEWDKFSVKTMRVNYSNYSIDIVFSNNECSLPIIEYAGPVEIGVFAGDLHTTSPASIQFIKSVKSTNGATPDPAPEVYDQIMEIINGFSAEVSKTDHTTRIVITDPEGTTVAEVKDGTWVESVTYIGKDSEGGNVYEMKMSDGTTSQFTVPKDESGGTAVTKDGTVVSPNADFAEVAEWSDGNPDNEDRTGYFVCANVPLDGIVMKKATSLDDVKGVTIKNPAFAGNYTEDKLDSEGNLLPKYSYVAVIGFVPVIDNGTCTVGGRCMPDDNGCAIPSSNSMGYQVVNRIDERRVLIIVEPNGDMVQRIKTKVNQLQEDIDNLAPDQHFDPTSPNAQSGVAVAEAVNGKVDKKEWVLLNDITLTEAVNKIDEGMYDNPYDEIWIDATIKFETDFGTTAKTGTFGISFVSAASTCTEHWNSITDGRTEYLRAYGYHTPTGYSVWDTVHSNYWYLVTNSKYAAGGTVKRKFDQCLFKIDTEGIRFGAGTTIKVWGR